MRLSPAGSTVVLLVIAESICVLSQIGHVRKICALQVGALQVGVLHVGHPEVGVAKVGPAKIGLHEVGDAQFRAFKIGILEVGAVEIGFLQSGVPDTQPGALFALCCDPFLMVRKNFF